jgi:hypothetical protein
MMRSIHANLYLVSIGTVSQILFLMVLLKKVSVGVTYRLSYDVFVYPLKTKYVTDRRNRYVAETYTDKRKTDSSNSLYKP